MIALVLVVLVLAFLSLDDSFLLFLFSVYLSLDELFLVVLVLVFASLDESFLVSLYLAVLVLVPLSPVEPFLLDTLSQVGLFPIDTLLVHDAVPDRLSLRLLRLLCSGIV